MINAAIIGAAGLSGLELVRILTRHPQVALQVLTSSKYAGQTAGEAFPELGPIAHTFQPHDTALNGCDVTFLAIPNKASMDLVPRLLDQGQRVVDLSGVFRLRDVEVFRKYYGFEHTAPDALQDAVFGLPEAYREVIPGARLIGNPGCYPTGVLLGILPLGDHVAQLAVAPVIDAKSGVSGAGGRVEDDATNFMEVNENFKAYKVFAHQHTPEIGQVLRACTPFDEARQGEVIFTPHLLPLGRGILSTIYLRFTGPMDAAGMRSRFEEFAAREPFVTLLPEGRDTELKMVQGRNECVISLHHDASCKNWIVLTAIDNLIKGAAGQAVQNMNLMFDFDESAGLI